MDFLQIALIFLICLLAVFLTITGVQVFFILKDLKQTLDRINKVLEIGEGIERGVEKPIHAASNLITSGAKVLSNTLKRDTKPKHKRFYKKVL
ncbi:hypothetical protein HYS94_00215 [Candidatus Daviesbacteria bacterium]|nr:hypothetical protein [Candidatus Daviesbacteria bacterium]